MEEVVEKEHKCQYCGKVFNSGAALGGHTSNCKKYYIKQYGSLELYTMIKQTQLKQRSNTIVAKTEEERAKQDKLWKDEKHLCERCGKIMLEKFGTGRFCSRSCANSRQHGEDTIRKISKSMISKMLTYNCVDCGKQFLSSKYIEQRRYCLCKSCRQKKHSKQHISSIKDVSKRTITKILNRIGAECSLCGWNKATCDVHHIVPRSCGGTDDNFNLIIVCPNCHREIHCGKSDYSAERLSELSIGNNEQLWESIKNAYHPSN